MPTAVGNLISDVPEVTSSAGAVVKTMATTVTADGNGILLIPIFFVVITLGIGIFKGLSKKR